MTESKTSIYLLGSIQWLFFMFTNTVVIPLSVGAAFQLPPEAVESTMRISFILTGAACLIQALFGHKLPLMEGQSGLWWSLILSLGAATASTGGSLEVLGGSLSMGLILSGLVVALLGALGVGKVLSRWFTPNVMAVFLFLLSFQLSSIFFKGMLGLTTRSTIHLPEAGLSVGLVILVLVLSIKGKGTISNYAILIGIIVGWIAYTLLLPVPAEQAAATEGGSGILLFPWGSPSVDIGILLTALLAGLVNMTNNIASIKGAEPIYNRKTEEPQVRRSLIWTGLFTSVSGVFGTVPYAPYSSSLGFLLSTRILERAPFIIGASMFTLIGIIPVLGNFFSSLPISVGDAVLFAAYLQLLGSALRNVEGVTYNYKTIYRIAIPVLLGVSLLTVSPTVFASLPGAVRPLISNGLLVGVLFSIALERGVKWDAYEVKPR
ncbi:uracil/xanthine transporter [Paenibacillus swuensis]|uniref:Uracil/xanthine transporter n=1 Tax=Paenibacillus swuensis TaxID=1178515 RepID=A0A172TFI3_9BACL|nr:uracil/xanthine transporter [Paenibacillus swuensis]ANE45637.1 uracil/xanthine transporter [Paenibacillus swuensis]